MNNTTKQSFAAITAGAGRFALQWRLLVLWVAVLLIPTALMVFPMWGVLSEQLDHTLHASELAHQLTPNAIADLLAAFHAAGIVQSAATAALIVTLLCSPLLSGMAISAARKKNEAQTFGGLMHGAISEYGRMFRLSLWAIVPLGVAGGIGSAVINLADDYSRNALLRSDADLANHAALGLTLLLLAIALVTVDAGRAQFALSVKRRSAIKAWWRGCKLLIKRPVDSIGSYLALSIAGLLVAALLAFLRINVPHVSLPGFLLGLMLTQLAAAALAWMRNARLFALIDMAREETATGMSY